MKVTMVLNGPREGIYFDTPAELKAFMENPKVVSQNDISVHGEVKTANGLKLLVGQPLVTGHDTMTIELAHPTK